jgi:hypothetical protein
MKIKTFQQYFKLNENSDLDWSDKNWDERGQDAENPPSNGFEGSSAEPMNYSAGITDEEENDFTQVDDNFQKKKIKPSDKESIRILLQTIGDRISLLEKKKKLNVSSKSK